MKTREVSREIFNRMAVQRGPQFAREFLKNAEERGDVFFLDPVDFMSVVRAHPMQTRDPLQRILPVEPTAAELAANFTSAMERWASAGFKTVSREEYDARSRACEPCDYWDGAARFGLGKCNAPGCGCTKFKRWLATEKCTLNKWPTLKA
jgi:hypothetical protein